MTGMQNRKCCSFQFENTGIGGRKLEMIRKHRKSRRNYRILIALLTFIMVSGPFSLIPVMAETSENESVTGGSPLPGTLYVGGVQMAPSGPEQIDLASGTASFDRVTNTLTLKNACYKGSGFTYSERIASEGAEYSVSAGIYYKGKGETLNIVLDGENTIDMELPDNKAFSASDSVGSSYDYYDASAAVYVESADVAIIGHDRMSDILSVSGADGGAQLAESSGILVDADDDFQEDSDKEGGKLTVENCTINAKGQSAQACGYYETGESEGFYTENELILNNASVTATGGKAGNDSAGIEAGNKMQVLNSTVTGTSGEAARASFGIFMDHDAEIVNSTVTGTAGNVESCRSCYGIDAEGNIRIDQSTMTGTGGPAERYSDGIYFDYMAEITDSTVTGLSGKGDQSAAGIYSDTYLLVSRSKFSGISMDSNAKKSHGIHAKYSFHVLDGSNVEGIAGKASNNSIGINVDGLMNIKDNSRVTARSNHASRISCGADIDSFLAVEKGSLLEAAGGGDTTLSVGVRCRLIAAMIQQKGTDYLFADYGVKQEDAYQLTGEIIAKAVENGAKTSIGMELVSFLGDVDRILEDDELQNEKDHYIQEMLGGDETKFNEDDFYYNYLISRFENIRRTGDLYVYSDSGYEENNRLNVTGMLTVQGADGGLGCLIQNEENDTDSDSTDEESDQRETEESGQICPVALTSSTIRAGLLYDGSDATIVDKTEEQSFLQTDKAYQFITTKLDENEDHGENGFIDCQKDETCPVSPFSDADPKAWYHDGVHWGLQEGIMNGTGEHMFEPMVSTSRAMIVTMLWRMEDLPQMEVGKNFTDVQEGMWYTEAVRWAAENGIVKGYSEDIFAPDDPVTREQIVTILYRYAQLIGLNVDDHTTAYLKEYSDVEMISDWADTAFCWAVNHGVIQGMDEDLLSPGTDAVRAQVATILMRFVQLV